MKQLFIKIGIAMSWIDDTSAEERLANLIKEHKHSTLIERIKAIREEGDYIPNYNAPKAYTEIQIMCDDKPISFATKVSCERPIDFDNDVKAWKKIVQLSHKKDLKEEKKKKQQLLDFIEQRTKNYNMAIAPYLTVD